MGKGFRKFDQNIRDQAAIDFLESNESAEEIGRRYDTSGTSISNWAKKFLGKSPNDKIHPTKLREMYRTLYPNGFESAPAASPPQDSEIAPPSKKPDNSAKVRDAITYLKQAEYKINQRVQDGGTKQLDDIALMVILALRTLTS